MNNLAPTIQIISITAISIPICIAALRQKKAGLDIRLFLLFLLIGLITDITMFYLVRTKQYTHLLAIFNTYSLIESLVFYWFTLRNISVILFRLIARTLLFITPVFWILFVVLFPSLLFDETSASQVFDTVYEIAVAFLSGFALLKMVEREESVLVLPGFWILLGIFFYCFCTFFIMGFLNTFLSHQIWFLNNIINILTYIFYSIGLWQRQPYSANQITT